MLNQIIVVDFISRIEHLCAEKQSLLPMVQSFKERVICTYHVRVLLELKAAFLSDNVTQELERVLEENWKHVKGTLLGYTTQPEDSVTVLLCDIAQSLSTEIKRSALTVLMPGLLTDMMPDELLNGEIKTILCTHIVSECGKYVLPVDILCQLTLPEDPGQQWANPYYDITDTEDNCYIKLNEKKRLFNHSTETKVLFNAKEEYKRFLNKESLLGHLNELVQQLRFNGAHQGIGAQNNAGSGAYSAIIRFNDYYNLLNSEQKHRIPEKLKNEIETLITLSEDPSKNISATENMETCISTREEKMSPEIREHQVLLNDIGIDAEKSTELLRKAKDTFEKQSHMLKEQLKQNQYKGGRDTLPVTKALLDYLNMPLSISSPEELNDFLRCSPNEMHGILSSDKSIHSQIIEQLETLEIFVTLMLQTSSARLKVLLFHIGQGVIEKHIHNSSDISACLMFLDEERFEIVLNVLQLKIKTGFVLCEVMSKITTAKKRNVVYETLQNKLPEMINSAYDFSCILNYLTLIQCAETCQAIKHKLPKIIRSPHDFNILFTSLSSERKSIVFVSLKDKLLEMLYATDDISAAISILSLFKEVDQILYTETYEKIKGKLPDMIKSADDFLNLAKLNTPKQCEEIYSSVSERVPKIIKSGTDFHKILEIITPEQRMGAYEALKINLPKLIKSSKTFHDILKLLTPNQRTEVYEALKPKLASFIKSSGNFRDILRFLTPDQAAAIYELTKDSLPKIIKTANDLGYVLQRLSPENRLEVFESFKDDVSQLIKNVEDFVHIVCRFDHEACMRICKSLKDTLPDVVKNPYSFHNLLRCFSSEHQSVLYELFKERLPKMITTPNYFAQALLYLTPTQRMEVYEQIKGNLPKIFRKENDYNDLCVKYDFIKEIIPNYAAISQNRKQKPENSFDPLVHQEPLLFTGGLHSRNLGRAAVTSSSTPVRTCKRA